MQVIRIDMLSAFPRILILSLILLPICFALPAQDANVIHPPDTGVENRVTMQGTGEGEGLPAGGERSEPKEGEGEGEGKSASAEATADNNGRDGRRIQRLSMQDDTLTVQEAVEKPHSAHKATIYSALLPGLGQAYNQKYWKIPVIYGGFATLAYFISMNTKEYRKFRDAYNYVQSGDTTGTDNDYVFKYSSNSLLQGRDYYRRNMEFSYILSALLYLLNIVDAAVDAHLWDFDVSDDLSMRVQPMILPSSGHRGLNGGISLSFSFR